MTINEIMIRRGLDIVNTVMPEAAQSGTPIKEYMFCYRGTFKDYDGHNLCVDVIGYYPEPDVYLLKYKGMNSKRFCYDCNSSVELDKWDTLDGRCIKCSNKYSVLD